MALTLYTFGQVTFIIGLLTIFSIIAFASLFPHLVNTLVFAVILLFGALGVMYKMAENE